MDTPFGQIYGHDFSVTDISDIFIEDQGMTKEFIEKHSSFIWGVRGSGKSMMLKYFDIEVQRVKHNGFKQVLLDNGFIGIYLLFKRGVFNTPNLEENNEHRPKAIHKSILYILSEHLILLSILEVLFEKLQNTIDFEFTTDGNADFYHAISEMLSCKEELDADSSYNELFRTMRSCLREGIRNAKNCLTTLATGNNADFSKINFLDYVMFCEIIRSIQTWIYVKCETKPLFYFLFDDVNFLFTYQQKILNTWIGQRQTDIICFKLASEPFGYKSFMTLPGDSELQNVADYHEISLDFDVIYKKQRQRKREIYMAISERRLARFKKFHPDIALPDSIIKFLPSDQQQDDRIEELRNELSKQYSEKERERSRQVMPELHRLYGRVYCGFDDVVTLSFGNIRDFLILCDYLYNASQKLKLSILPSIEQNHVIREFSHEMLDFRSHLSISADATDNQLYTFMLNILSLIRYRLRNENLMERTFDAFIIKNISSLTDDAKAVLRKGIVLRLFRKSYYTSRKYLRRDVFIINKRLFPEYELNISEAGGRFEFTAEQFYKALQDESYFVNELSKESVALGEDGQLSLFEPQDEYEFDGEEKYEYDYGRLY